MTSPSVVPLRVSRSRYRAIRRTALRRYLESPSTARVVTPNPRAERERHGERGRRKRQSGPETRSGHPPHGQQPEAREPRHRREGNRIRVIARHRQGHHLLPHRLSATPQRPVPRDPSAHGHAQQVEGRDLASHISQRRSRSGAGSTPVIGVDCRSCCPASPLSVMRRTIRSTSRVWSNARHSR